MELECHQCASSAGVLREPTLPTSDILWKSHQNCSLNAKQNCFSEFPILLVSFLSILNCLVETSATAIYEKHMPILFQTKASQARCKRFRGSDSRPDCCSGWSLPRGIGPAWNIICLCSNLLRLTLS